MLLAHPFHQRTSLLELSEGGCVEPHILRIGVHLFLQDTEGSPFTAPHLAHLDIEATVDRNT